MIGNTLGPYQILSKLGEGGMGQVYRARDTRLDRIVALKVLPPDRVSDTEARSRFEREARAIAALSHPNICAIHDVGLADAAAPPYLVMELLEGQTLQERLLRGPLDLDQLIDHAAALADALDAAHARGLIHRDLKPANIFLTSRGIPKILDFGLAKPLAPSGPGAQADSDVTRQSGDALTEMGTTVGTVAYMSPEQLRGETLDLRSDLFSFGLVLYEMATGQRAFAGATSAMVSAAILMQEPAAPTAVRPDLPPRLEETILKALEKDRTVRCQSAAELRADLVRLKRQSGSQVTRTSAAPAARPDVPAGATPATTAAASPQASSGHQASRGRGLWMLVGAAAAVVLLAGAYWLGLGRGGDAGPAGAAPPPGPPPAVSAPPPPPTTVSAAAQPPAAGAAPADRGGPPPVPPDRSSTRRETAPAASPAAATPAPDRGGPLPGEPSPGPRGGRGAGGRRGLGPAGAALVSVLQNLPPLPFDVAYAAGDDRAREMAIQLRTALAAAGWKPVNTSEAQNPPAALAVFVPEPSPSATAFVGWAKRNGFNPEIRVTPRIPRLRVVIGR